MAKKGEQVFKKEQLLKANKYLKYQDILNAFLKDNKEYSIEEVDKIINNFLTTKVR